MGTYGDLPTATNGNQQGEPMATGTNGNQREAMVSHDARGVIQLRVLEKEPPSPDISKKAPPSHQDARDPTYFLDTGEHLFSLL